MGVLTNLFFFYPIFLYITKMFSLFGIFKKVFLGYFTSKILCNLYVYGHFSFGGDRRKA